MRSLIVGFVLVSAVTAQSERLLGRVVDAGGAAVVDAEVVLHAEPALAHAGDGPHRVTIRSDKRGRFRTRLYRDRNYSAWATWKDADGRVRWSRVATPVQFGKMLKITEADSEPAQVRVHFIGRKLWSELGESLQFRIVEPGGRRSPLVVGDDDMAPMPMLPGDRCTIEAMLDGRVLFTRLISLTKNGRAEVRKRLSKEKAGIKGKPLANLPDVAKRDLPPLDIARIVLPPPLRVPIRVVDAATKKPVVGARVVCESVTAGLGERPLRTTDAKGEVEFRLARDVDSWGRARTQREIYFHVLAPGYAMAEEGWSSWGRSDMKKIGEVKIENGAMPRLEVALRPGKTLQGKVLGAEGKPAVGVTVVARVPGRRPSKGGGYYTLSHDDLYRTDSDGVVNIVGIDGKASQQTVIGVILADTPPENGRRTVPVLRWIDWNPAQTPVLDLRALVFADVRLRLPDGVPAASAEVRLIPAKADPGDSSRTDGVFAARSVRTNRRGQCKIPVSALGGTLLAIDDDHYCVRKLPAELNESIDIDLKPYLIVQGRVVDANGAPAVNASVYVRSQTWSESDALTNVVSSINDRLMKATTDKSGRYRIRFVANRGLTYGLGATVRSGGKSLRSSQDAEVRGESREDADITLDGVLAKGGGKK